jgi:hypothetical protein
MQLDGSAPRWKSAGDVMAKYVVHKQVGNKGSQSSDQPLAAGVAGPLAVAPPAANARNAATRGGGMAKPLSPLLLLWAQPI